MIQARAEWIEGRQPIMRGRRVRLIFLDETSTDTKMTRTCGRCAKGARLHANAPFGRWRTQTLIAGFKCDGLVAPWVINAPIERASFDTHVETKLGPVQAPVYVVDLDNLAAHKSERADKAVRAKGAWILFLPPYCPDLTSIEVAFAKLQSWLRKSAARTIEDLWKAIGNI